MEQLRKLRLERGLSLRTLGVMAGIHAVSLGRLEGGKFDPRLSTLRKLAQALEVSVCDLIDQPHTKKGGPQHGTEQTKGRVVRGVSRRR
jgi:transcriptional regulator with XRE-family HTH domain